MKIIGCDKDGVICNFSKEYTKYYNKLAKASNQNVFDLDWEPDIYYYHDNPLIDKKINDTIVSNYFPDIMKNAEMYPGAKEFINELDKLSPFMSIITHQYSDESKLSTLEWLVKNNLPYSCVFSHGDDKWKYCDILIDDKIENLELMTKNGKIGICIAREWNKNYNGIRVKEYKDIINCIKWMN